jgi:hypothetical protein
MKRLLLLTLLFTPSTRAADLYCWTCSDPSEGTSMGIPQGCPTLDCVSSTIDSTWYVTPGTLIRYLDGTELRVTEDYFPMTLSAIAWVKVLESNGTYTQYTVDQLLKQCRG